jgi:ATP-dependent Lon protease
MIAEVDYFELTQDKKDVKLMALGKSLKQHVQKAISLSPNIPNEASLFIENIQNPVYLADLVVPYLSLDYTLKQELLEIRKKEDLLKRVNEFVMREVEILNISQQINTEVKTEVGKQQRKYFIKEQLRLLQKELNDIEGRSSVGSDANELEERLGESNLPDDVAQAIQKEIDKMQMMQPGAPEYTVSYNYASCLLDIPWLKLTGSFSKPQRVQTILDRDHHGLQRVKERITEHIAVNTLNEKIKGPILLFVGPPGVGKTSLGESIARALKRKFARISLGGVRDEAEIRGHRRTYIGSLPGKFVEALKKVGAMDPVILLDELDKISTDFRGDPSSALLEALDPQQNHQFTDHYVGLPIDLSRVIFLATANRLDTISSPLLDRMEVIELSGYTEQEKCQIAKTYLIPQVIKENGLENRLKLSFQSKAVLDIIHFYTREAGVRQLKRELSRVARRVAVKYLEDPTALGKKMSIKSNDLEAYLEQPKYIEEDKPNSLPVGVSTGLAYTPYGGSVLMIETARAKGTGKLHVTGQLGEVMKESIEIAQALILSRPECVGVGFDELKKTDLHIHVPAGAVKKDGPSAGVAIMLAMASQYLKSPLSPKWAFTGEISLRAQVLPVGGIKEKVLAAQRYGIKQVLIPKQNQKDLIDIPQDVFEKIEVKFVENLNDVFSLIFPTVWENQKTFW